MTSIVEAAIETLYEARIPLGPGLTNTEIADVEQQFDIRFSPDHVGLLSLATPIGPGWVDWLGEPDGIQQRLNWPLEGALFDVEQNAFWPDEWGERPSETAAALQVAREQMRLVPTLIPIYSHRYLPGAPAPEGSPVFSVHQTDVIYFGSDLAAYFAAEFFRDPDLQTPTHRVDFWSDLAEGRWT
ncbi:hypothetical protein DXK94_02905 [Arthrobacter sp. RT-1]|uniref:hypothetical protein n=1 Tax=Arthrobacter sp. RT-1 TaxID=2292263 RepID=UPI000E1F1068|nr:hypothetical protein [Arthrobacter sp. RT-1]RDV12286.1 hypothetical protein DXK94_02905 [Arthrobacter sp. RT-1]